MIIGKGKLLSEGQRGTGVVIDKKAGATSGLVVHTWNVRVRAHFDDGTTGEVDASLHVHRSGMIPHDDLVPEVEVGDTVPVRYDPHDHSKVLVDIPELHARREASEARNRQQKTDQDARAVAGAEEELGRRKH